MTKGLLILGHLTQWRLCHYSKHFEQYLTEILLYFPNWIEKPTLTSAAAMVVSSAFVSYAGATSTISAETMCNPSSPRRMVRSSRVDQPPVSGVPVAGANAGSIESICPNNGSGPRYILARLHPTHINGKVDWIIPDDLSYLLDDPAGS